jgi:hypothetical protein
MQPEVDTVVLIERRPVPSSAGRSRMVAWMLQRE